MLVLRAVGQPPTCIFMWGSIIFKRKIGGWLWVSLWDIGRNIDVFPPRQDNYHLPTFEAHTHPRFSVVGDRRFASIGSQPSPKDFQRNHCDIDMAQPKVRQSVTLRNRIFFKFILHNRDDNILQYPPMPLQKLLHKQALLTLQPRQLYDIGWEYSFHSFYEDRKINE